MTPTDTPDPLRICIVLDKSGSMSGSAVEALEAVNTYIAKAKADKNQSDALLSILLFDGASLEWIRRNVSIHGVAPVDAEEYQPNASTPLFDAIGTAIDALEGTSKAAIAIVTDGYENASRQYNLKTIRAKIKAAEDRGWMVQFLGAGLDIAAQASDMGLSQAKAAAFRGRRGLRASGEAMSSLFSRYAATSGRVQAHSVAFAGWTDEERRLLDGDAPAQSAPKT